MNIDILIVSPIISLISGILILLIPRLLNYIVAIYSSSSVSSDFRPDFETSDRRVFVTTSER